MAKNSYSWRTIIKYNLLYSVLYCAEDLSCYCTPFRVLFLTCTFVSVIIAIGLHPPIFMLFSVEYSNYNTSLHLLFPTHLKVLYSFVKAGHESLFTNASRITFLNAVSPFSITYHHYQTHFNTVFISLALIFFRHGGYKVD